jgi:dihydrofolate synthase/folylpolyglutamate synthase
MGDKDVRGMLETWSEVMQQIVVTQVASTSRGMPADELGELAAGVFGAERVTVARRLDDALETAVTLAEADGVGAAGVLVTGSVVLVGEARTLLVRQQASDDTAAAEAGADRDDDWVADELVTDDRDDEDLDDDAPADVGLVDADLTGVAVEGESLTPDPDDEDDPFADDLFADDPDESRYEEWDADQGPDTPGTDGSAGGAGR